MQIFIEIPPNRSFFGSNFRSDKFRMIQIIKQKMLYIKTIIKRDHFKYAEYNLVSQQKQHLK